MQFDNICEMVHETAVKKGFWPEDVDDIFITKQLMMIVSEAVEVMEAIRKDKGSAEVADEMADILIRTFDLYAGLVENGYTDVSLDYAFKKKTTENRDRPELHGGKF
jgi:NTP pyrophosphatase (non-canonical NTP hydrolase)